MPEFKVPMRWDLQTMEVVEAKDRFAAEEFASRSIEKPSADPSTWDIKKRIDGVDWQKMEKMYPIPREPQPMDDWECLKEPGAYEGGYWKIDKGDYVVNVIGDDGPIDVGMSFATYTWKVSSDSLPYDIESKITYNNITECRDAALEALEKIKKM